MSRMNASYCDHEYSLMPLLAMLFSFLLDVHRLGERHRRYPLVTLRLSAEQADVRRTIAFRRFDKEDTIVAPTHVKAPAMRFSA